MYSQLLINSNSFQKDTARTVRLRRTAGPPIRSMSETCICVKSQSYCIIRKTTPLYVVSNVSEKLWRDPRVWVEYSVCSDHTDSTDLTVDTGRYSIDGALIMAPP
jgi:hypothetical protein